MFKRDADCQLSPSNHNSPTLRVSNMKINSKFSFEHTCSFNFYYRHFKRDDETFVGLYIKNFRTYFSGNLYSLNSFKIMHLYFFCSQHSRFSDIMSHSPYHRSINTTRESPPHRYAPSWRHSWVLIFHCSYSKRYVFLVSKYAEESVHLRKTWEAAGKS